MKEFEISGQMRIGRRMQAFTKKVKANSKKLAEAYTYSKLGSDHNLKRANIQIADIKEAK